MGYVAEFFYPFLRSGKKLNNRLEKNHFSYLNSMVELSCRLGFFFVAQALHSKLDTDWHIFVRERKTVIVQWVAIAIFETYYFQLY